MKQYELLTVLPGTLSEDEVTPIIAQVRQVLTDNSAENLLEEVVGKSRLTYPMKHIRYGFYHVFTFGSEPEGIVAIQTQLRLIPELLRALVTTFVPEKRADAKARLAKAAARYQSKGQSKKDEGEEKVKEKKPKPAVKKKPATSIKKEETVVEPVSIEDIDKKLDALLDEDIASL